MMPATPVLHTPKTHPLATLLQNLARPRMAGPRMAVALLASLALAHPCFAQSQPGPAPHPANPSASATAERAVTATERREVIEELAKDLSENFVFPEVATRYAAMLRANLASGKYDHLSDPVALGKQVTSDLQAVAPDGHLRFGLESGFMQMKSDAKTAKPRPPALADTKMIGNVAYLQFNAFPHDATIAATARQFLLDHADARAVIIDSRTNRGGDLTIMDQVFPLLFAQPATLVRMDTRAVEGASAPSQSMVWRDSPKDILRHDHVVTPDTHETRLQKVPVYYLVSKKTASAAEHTALAFKRTGRAQLIGQTTGGYGHYGGMSKQGERFAAFIPVGRTYDPDTNWDWEGVGVAPDVVVDSDAALDEALKRANGAQVAQAKAVATPPQ